MTWLDVTLTAWLTIACGILGALARRARTSGDLAVVVWLAIAWPIAATLAAVARVRGALDRAE